MRDLTEDEISEYFDWAESDRKAADFNPEQAQLVVTALADSGLLTKILPKLLDGLARGYQPEDLFASLWVQAFQMGRECESRLLTLALKHKGW